VVFFYLTKELNTQIQKETQPWY